MRLSGITANTSYFGLNEEKIRAGIESNRYLRFESMEKVWPNGVILNIQERQPCINVLNAGIQYVVASDGMVLEAYASLRLDNGCIKTTGLNIRDIRVGSQVICYNSEQLDAMLNTLPLEVTFVDGDDINRYWNDDGEKKLFKRPSSALGREVWSCHPPKVQEMVRRVISTLKSGEQDSVDIWMEKEGEPVLVRYMAVRDRGGSYVGTMEVVQRMGFARDHFGA